MVRLAFSLIVLATAAMPSLAHDLLVKVVVTDLAVRVTAEYEGGEAVVAGAKVTLAATGNPAGTAPDAKQDKGQPQAAAGQSDDELNALLRRARLAERRHALTVPILHVRLPTLHSRSTKEVDHATDCTRRFLGPLRSQRVASPSHHGRSHATASERGVKFCFAA